MQQIRLSLKPNPQAILDKIDLARQLCGFDIPISRKIETYGEWEYTYGCVNVPEGTLVLGALDNDHFIATAGFTDNSSEVERTIQPRYPHLARLILTIYFHQEV